MEVNDEMQAKLMPHALKDELVFWEHSFKANARWKGDRVYELWCE
jgi:hypothetical protein